MKGYILDLRNNPGGLLDQAVTVSNAFLDRGEIARCAGATPTTRSGSTPSPIRAT